MSFEPIGPVATDASQTEIGLLLHRKRPDKCFIFAETTDIFRTLDSIAHMCSAPKEPETQRLHYSIHISRFLRETGRRTCSVLAEPTPTYAMQRPAKSVRDAAQLLRLIDLISSAGRTVIDEWSKESVLPTNTSEIESLGSETTLPSRRLYESQKIMLAAAGMLTEVVAEPANRLLEISMQYFEARALHIVAERRIPDLLAAAEVANEGRPLGLSGKEIGDAVGIEHRKLSRLLRCLCSIHVFKEASSDRFDNNSASAVLVKNEPFRAYILLFGLDAYTASDQLPRTLLDAQKGPSYDVSETAFQGAVGTSKPVWEWLEEKATAKELRSRSAGWPAVPSLDLQQSSDENALVSRPELEIFGLAMLGGGRVNGAAHVYDYDWASLGDALVVDVGGGVGGFSMQLSFRYPRLRFIVQDRGPLLDQAREEVWPKDNPAALKDGRVSFMPHDFFQKNPVEGADVYWLRYILHDWSDEYCVQILTGIRESMGAKSRVLICDQVMNTTIGCAEIAPAPEPLPANYGYCMRYSHQRDFATMSILNGIERTPEQFKELAESVGLKLQKIWECRSQASLIELVLPA